MRHGQDVQLGKRLVIYMEIAVIESGMDQQIGDIS
jgi:hypothetical protein